MLDLLYQLPIILFSSTPSSLRCKVFYPFHCYYDENVMATTITIWNYSILIFFLYYSNSLLIINYYYYY